MLEANADMIDILCVQTQMVAISPSLPLHLATKFFSRVCADMMANCRQLQTLNANALVANLHQTSSVFLTISVVGVLGIIFFIRFLSSLVTREGVMGTQGV